MRTERYGTLDALRGVAALAIVVYHLNALRIDGPWMPHGYLAVDFFFVLSGFVIAHAYAGPLAGAMTWRRFALRRVIRLLPLAVLGALLGLGVLLIKWRFVPDRVDGLARILLSGLFGALLLPAVTDGPASRFMLFPTDPPLWSLFFELLVNLAWARVGVRASTRVLGAAVLASGVANAALAAAYGSLDQGWEFPSFAGGLVRAVFGFSLGLLLHRSRGRVPALPWWPMPLLLAALLLAAFALPDQALHLPALARDLACAYVVLPLIVALGIGQGEGGRLGAALGELSYPLYALHFPLLTLAAGVHERLPQLNPHLVSAAGVAVALATSVLALRCYDRPLRRRLTRAVAGAPVPGATRPLPAT